MSRVFSTFFTSQVIRRQRAYTKDDMVKTRFIFRVLFLVAFMAILSLFYIWSRVQIVQYGYQINVLRHQQLLLFEEEKRLQVEVAALKSPHRLMEKAASLGMSPPTDLRRLR